MNIPKVTRAEENPPPATGGHPSARPISRRGALVSGLAGATAALAGVRASGAEPPRAAPAGGARTVQPGVPAGPGVRQHVGEGITVQWRGKLCIHARHCVTVASRVFTPDGVWDLGEASVDHVAHVIRQCPSGALRYQRTDGGPQEVPPHVNVIRVFENGPLAVHAELLLPGTGAVTRATLCRCGQSANKPFCDGAHNDGFVATGQPPSGTTAKLHERGGLLEVRPLRDGPYEVTGNVEICAAGGRVVARGTSARLCRCGYSATKPFCDGSHDAMGFTAPGA